MTRPLTVNGVAERFWRWLCLVIRSDTPDEMFRHPVRWAVRTFALYGLAALAAAVLFIICAGILRIVT